MCPKKVLCIGQILERATTTVVVVVVEGSISPANSTPSSTQTVQQEDAPFERQNRTETQVANRKFHLVDTHSEDPSPDLFILLRSRVRTS